MKLKCTFDFVDMGDEIIAVPIGPNSDEIGGVFKLNKEGMEILKLLNDGLSREEVIDHLSSTLRCSRLLMRWQKSTICRSCIPAIRVLETVWSRPASNSIRA